MAAYSDFIDKFFFAYVRLAALWPPLFVQYDFK